ncbi:hypothetical protein CC117_32715 [Parafrankia colletiae]|uniref:Acyl-CoA dehydrogenase n=1 Tax=Parafrankia colletiae TaxID=573497 RepID=A0A1S1RCA9_9ACTN|nr:acyl-CoA dehydrogenase family protein [Parafrankia colletiae]OHV43409.1 hypothetical protein CC117_32715 [Parafrankia colletiae]
MSPEVDLDFLTGIETFIDRVVRPVESRYAEELEETGTIAPERQLAERRLLRRRSAEDGLYSAGIPKDLGGGGLDVETIAHGYRIVGRSGLLLADRGGVLPNVEGPQTSMRAMNEDQRRRYLEPLLRAEIEGCFAITEPDAGSDASQVLTKARQEGDEWIINGTKQFITHGQYADFVQVVAKTDPDERPSRRLSVFIVDKGTPGFSVGATHHTMGEDRPVDLVFDDVRVPASAMVGDRGGALRYAIGSISQARINVGSLAIGKSQYLLQQMIGYASMREAFGKKIGAFQFIQGHIVESSMEIEAALGILRTATTLAGEDTDEARRLAATVKVYATETLTRVADRAIQVHGGLGVTRAGGVERFYRDARAMRIYEGTSELLRWNMARWLGLPAQ